MLQVQSELSKELAACTICTGVVLSDGERIGAIADVDIFAAFDVDMEVLANQRNKEKCWAKPFEAKGFLYDVRKKPNNKMVDKKVSKQVGKVVGVAELVRRSSLGLDLFGDGSEASKLSEAELTFKGIEDEDFENSVEE